MKYPNPNITPGRVKEVWNKLGGEEGVQRLLSGASKVVMGKHLIDCDVDPFVPDGWKVEENQRGGLLYWSGTVVKLYTDPVQKGREYIDGHILRNALKKQPVLNANVLDHLLKNPDLIPKNWKKDKKGNTRYIFFWGTIYSWNRWSGNLYVRGLYWIDGRWDWCAFHFDEDWNVYWIDGVLGDRFAAVRAS